MPHNREDLRATLVLANAFKEGDLAVGGTRDDLIRSEARKALLGTRVADIRRTRLIDDGVSKTIERGRDRSDDSALDLLTIAQLKAALLARNAPAWAHAHRDRLPSEVIAAIAKVMTNEELSTVSRRVFNPLPGGGIAIGGPGHFGSRIQPNSPGDDEDEILFSIFDGLSCGCGDVIIGLNPAADELDAIVRLEQILERVVHRLDLPTRFCVLSDIVKQHQAQARTRIDVGFQSLAGTSRALSGMVGLDADGVLDLARGFPGLYFETGQGSAVTNGGAEGVDMVTLEARAYGVARMIQRETGAWTIVNDVAGFIGPEVFKSAEQLERACLEDMMMAKLHGITMGLDVCATFHMGISPEELRDVTDRVVDRAAPAYLMAVAGNADPMLGYLTTSFHDHTRLRRRSGRGIASAMEQRLATLDAGSAPRLYATFMKADGDRRTAVTLEDEGRRRLAELRERGFELHEPSPGRLEAIYANARAALYAEVDQATIRDSCPSHRLVRTRATDRDDYLAHPPSGERLRREDERLVSTLYPLRRPQVQVVISDGLNANAVNEQLRALMPPLRRSLAESGSHVSDTDIVISNGRVRAGYQIGGLLEAAAIIHILGERPGTGLNTLSAYLTYGRDAAGAFRWNPELDHACTTAVCGIHPRGKPPDAAAREIARTMAKILEERRSGVALARS